MSIHDIFSRTIFVALSISLLLGWGNPRVPRTLEDQDAAEISSVTPTISINLSAAGTPADERILGTNLPTWLNPYRFGDATFLARSEAAPSSLYHTFVWLTRANRPRARSAP